MILLRPLSCETHISKLVRLFSRVHRESVIVCDTNQRIKIIMHNYSPRTSGMLRRLGNRTKSFRRIRARGTGAVRLLCQRLTVHTVHESHV